MCSVLHTRQPRADLHYASSSSFRYSRTTLRTFDQFGAPVRQCRMLPRCFCNLFFLFRTHGLSGTMHVWRTWFSEALKSESSCVFPPSFSSLLPLSFPSTHTRIHTHSTTPPIPLSTVTLFSQQNPPPPLRPCLSYDYQAHDRLEGCRRGAYA